MKNLRFKVLSLLIVFLLGGLLQGCSSFNKKIDTSNLKNAQKLPENTEKERSKKKANIEKIESRLASYEATPKERLEAREARQKTYDDKKQARLEAQKAKWAARAAEERRVATSAPVCSTLEDCKTKWEAAQVWVSEPPRDCRRVTFLREYSDDKIKLYP